jgi:hypothetical protein
MVQDAGRTSDSGPHPMTLTAELTGPYADVSGLKSGAAATRTVHAPAIKTDDRTPTAPNSTLNLPSDLPPGLYNLAIGVDFGGGNGWSSGSVVKVGP